MHSAGSGNPVKVEGGMDLTRYQQILENNVEESNKTEVTAESGVPTGQRPKTLLQIK